MIRSSMIRSTLIRSMMFRSSRPSPGTAMTACFAVSPRPSRRRWWLALLMLTSTPAFAHVGVDDSAGLLHGLLHPLGGIDHVLAMTGVGLLGWMLSGHARWALPATFLVAMLLAATAAALHLPAAWIEAGIALSLLGTGVLLARGRPLPLAAAIGVVALFAGFHGQAHGSEVAVAGAGLAYASGFMLSTALLHGFGLLAGTMLARLVRRRALVVARGGGAMLSVAGGMLLIAAIAG
jgi:urease accessory protein